MWPHRTWERLSLVETITESSAFSIACSVTRVSGAAETKLPPRPMKKRALPSRSARIASTVSRPFSRGGSKPNSSRRASRKVAGGLSQIPIVRSPWTLEWPRTGHRPAPGRPMLPCSRATLTNSLIVLTALRCWVMPMAQQCTVALASMSIWAASRIWPMASPVARSTAPQSRSRRFAAYSSKCAVCRATKSWSTTVPVRASSSRRTAPIACQSARSPLTRIGR